jgi:hypothetical protein
MVVVGDVCVCGRTIQRNQSRLLHTLYMTLENEVSIGFVPDLYIYISCPNRSELLDAAQGE